MKVNIRKFIHLNIHMGNNAGISNLFNMKRQEIKYDLTQVYFVKVK